MGGGFKDGGILGSYFANDSLAGSPVFTRTDNRIDFNNDIAPPGGSPSGAFQSVGADGYSVRWSGQLIPKFNETYTFTVTADDGARVLIRPEGASSWTTLADTWSSAGLTEVESSIALSAGATYDIQYEYRELTGSATAKLEWRSEHTPREVIEPLGMTGVNLHEGYARLYADAMEGGRDEWGPISNYLGTPKVARDANGWPLTDGVNVVWEGKAPADMVGTYLLQFSGKADVSVKAHSATFTVNGVNYSTLPSGVGYDPATNKTSAYFKPAATMDLLALAFANSQRTAASPINTGVTDVKLMRPTSVGSAIPYSLDTLFDTNFKQDVARFTTTRWLTANSNTSEVNWADRRTPAYSKAAFSNRAVWEYEIALANEIGKDLYITIPMMVASSYLTNLANLIRYGSDGVNPYTSPQTNPVFAGLNSNLKIYIEWSNETWNWSFAQATAGANASAQAVANNTPDGQIINFDGKAPTGDFRRWTALKIVQASNIFRSVFGDAAMGDRVRPLLEYQYDNLQNTAHEALSFIDNYFNNADGLNHVADPHPVNYFLWGAGGALYFNGSNPRGAQTEIQFTGLGAESYTLSPGATAVAPTGSAWTFTGNAGVYREVADTPVLATQTLGALTSLAGSDQSLGFKFTVGATPVAVYDLGRWVADGNIANHTVRLIRASDKVTVASSTITTFNAAPGDFAYATLSIPVALSANTTYYLVSSEQVGKDQFYNSSTSVTASPGVTIQGAVSASYSDPAQPNNTTTWTFSDGPGGKTFGPVNLRFGPAIGNLGNAPDAPEGTNALFIGGTGSISQTINFTRTGVFALEFAAANKPNFTNAIRIYIDGVNITPNGSTPDPRATPWTPGNLTGGFDTRIYADYGSAPFTISTTGNRTIRIEGTGSASSYAFFDHFRINSVDAMYSAGIPGSAHQSNVANYGKYAQAYGLNVVGYEGGWSVGGDASFWPIQAYAARVDSRAKDSLISSIDSFTRAGGSLYMVGTYYHLPASASINASTQPLLQAIDQRNDTLPIDPNFGVTAPGPLSVSQRIYGKGEVEGTLETNDWMAWNLIIPEEGLYDIGLNSTAGATLALFIDRSATPFAEFSSGGQVTSIVQLAKGQHLLKVKSISGTATLTGGAIAPNAGLLAPSDLALATNSTLRWTDNSANESGFIVQRSTVADFTSGVVSTTVGPNVTSFTDASLDPAATYYYRVRAFTDQTQSAFTESATFAPLRPADSPAVTEPGLIYRYNENSYVEVSSYTTTVPLEVGVASNFDLSIRNRDTIFGVQFSGYINIPVAGTYTFFLSSDDGAKLLIGNTTVVTNNFTHDAEERTGSIRLAAGKHAITVNYFQNIAASSLAVAYAGPGLAKTVIPASALSHAVTPTVSAPVTLPALADSTVRDGSNQNTNYGSLPSLEVKKDGVGNYRETYLKFDLSTLSTIGHARLRLFGKLSDAVTNGINVSAYGIDSTTWLDTTLTFANRPTTPATLLASANVPDKTQRWIEWDITSYLQSQKSAGKSAVTIVLKTATGGALITFHSMNASANQPQLIVSQGSGSPPQSIIVSTSTLNIAEGSSNSFNIKLATAPSANVVISFTKSGDPDILTGTTSLTFTPANWDTAQVINLSAAEDADTANGSASFTLSSAGIASQIVTATELDNDAGASPTILPALASASVRDGSNQNTNYGSSPTLEVKKDGPGNYRESYLKFDLTNITTFTSAKLQLFGKISDLVTGGINVSLFDAPATSWLEESINFANKPATSGAAIATVNLSSKTASLNEFDLTVYLLAQKQAGKTAITLVLKALNSGALVTFNSDEAASSRPQISLL